MHYVEQGRTTDGQGSRNTERHAVDDRETCRPAATAAETRRRCLKYILIICFLVSLVARYFLSFLSLHRPCCCVLQHDVVLTNRRHHSRAVTMPSRAVFRPFGAYCHFCWDLPSHPQCSVKKVVTLPHSMLPLPPFLPRQQRKWQQRPLRRQPRHPPKTLRRLD